MSCGWPRARFHRCPCAPHGVRVARSDAIVGLAQERFEAEFARARRPVVVTGLLEMASAQEMRALAGRRHGFTRNGERSRDACGHNARGAPLDVRPPARADSRARLGLDCVGRAQRGTILPLAYAVTRLPHTRIIPRAGGLPNTSRDRGLGGTLAEWLDSEGESFVFDWSLHAPEARAANTGLILPTICHS